MQFQMQMFIAAFLSTWSSAYALFDIGVFKFSKVQMGKGKICYMNKNIPEKYVIARFESQSFLHCASQCNMAEGCFAAIYKDKECTKSKMPSPQISLTPKEGLAKSFSHIPLYTDGTFNYFGWFIIQRRIDGTTDFFRGWQDYVQGFGDPNHNFWRGLENIHQRTSLMDTELYIYMDTFEGEQFYARYDHFSVGSAATGYALNISGYSGSAGDSMVYDAIGFNHQGMKFSTYDNDQDKSSANCAITFKGAWWYNSCHTSNLNGFYLNGTHASYADGMNWYTAKGFEYSMKTTMMMIRMKV